MSYQPPQPPIAKKPYQPPQAPVDFKVNQCAHALVSVGTNSPDGPGFYDTTLYFGADPAGHVPTNISWLISIDAGDAGPSTNEYFVTLPEGEHSVTAQVIDNDGLMRAGPPERLTFALP